MIHILNGDALRDRFPPALAGPRIVVRECLVDGPVDGVTPEELFPLRTQFLAKAYGSSPEFYQQYVIPEYQKIRSIPADAEVCLWFEDDLFCQVNAWFVAALLDALPHAIKLYWVSPTADIQYGFGGMAQEDLLAAFRQKQLLRADDLANLATLWPAYQHQDFSAMLQLALALQPILPLLPTAVAAHIQRFPADGSAGRPENALRRLREELNTSHFGRVYQAFCQQEAIYGFGDLQVRRIWDSLS